MPIERGIAGLNKFGRRSANFFTIDSEDADSTYTDSADSSRTVYEFTTDGTMTIDITQENCVHTKTSRDLRFRGFRGTDPGSFAGGKSGNMDYLVAGGGAGGGPGAQNLGGGGGGGGGVKGYWPTVFPSSLQEPGGIEIGGGISARRFDTTGGSTAVPITMDVGAGAIRQVFKNQVELRSVEVQVLEDLIPGVTLVQPQCPSQWMLVLVVVLAPMVLILQLHFQLLPKLHLV